MASNAPRSAAFLEAQEAVGTSLRTYLRARRLANQSYDDIAYDLRKRGVTVTSVTVRSWCRRLGVANPVKATA